jgi:hypothetical protein
MAKEVGMSKWGVGKAIKRLGGRWDTDDAGHIKYCNISAG